MNAGDSAFGVASTARSGQAKPAVNLNSRTFAECVAVLSISLQVAIAAAVMSHLDMTTSALRRIIFLAAPALVVNHFVPQRHRMRVFGLVCIAALLVVMGGSPHLFWDGVSAVRRSAPILAIGGLLVGICLIKIRFWFKAFLLAVAAVVLALFRKGLIGSEALVIIWPVLASFVMFRGIVYLSEVSTMKIRPGLTESLSYFFLFPNGAVGLFPVVDFKTFLRSHYDADAIAIYRRGMAWISRGIVQLMVYRLIQQLLAVKLQDVTDGLSLIQFILVNVFLYLNVSGQFHLVIGLLLLFGFNLPETNHRYFLASSFTDYWRRINIYWKDFILAIFYYPVYFRFKKHSPTLALIVATGWSFFITWALHLYQTWWLNGVASVTGPDMVFWSVLGLLVLVNSLWESNYGRRRTLSTTTYTARQAMGLACRTAATFGCITVLWSVWSSPSIRQWIDVWRFADLRTVFVGVAALVTIMVATIGFEVLLPVVRMSLTSTRHRSNALYMTAMSSTQAVAPLMVLYALGSQPLQAKLQYATMLPVYDAINTGDSMWSEFARKSDGYYEQLADKDPANKQRWETFVGKPVAYIFYEGADPRRPVKDFRFKEFIPSSRLFAYHSDFETNQWGMRDQDYSVGKPPGTIRIALLGSSNVAGWGIRRSEMFDSIVEKRLNGEMLAGAGVRFEVLNFAVNELSPLGQISMVRNKVGAFKPDIVLLVAHPLDHDWVNRDLSRALREHVPIESNYLESVLRSARVTARTHPVLATERLKPYEQAVLEWSYKEYAIEVRKLGAQPAAIFLPVPSDLPLSVVKATQQIDMLMKAGLSLLDLTHIFDSERVADIELSEQDHHANARAHALVSDEVYRRLVTDPSFNLAERTARARVAPLSTQTTEAVSRTQHHGLAEALVSR